MSEKNGYPKARPYVLSYEKSPGSITEREILWAYDASDGKLHAAERIASLQEQSPRTWTGSGNKSAPQWTYSCWAFGPVVTKEDRGLVEAWEQKEALRALGG